MQNPQPAKARGFSIKNNYFVQGILFAVVTGLCWAVLAIGLKYALRFSSSGTIVWIRMVFASALIVAYAAARKPKSLKKVFKTPHLRVALAAAFLSVNYFGFMKGVELTTASNAQIMIQMGPLALLFIGVFYFGEKLRKVQWLAITVAMVGFVFFNWDQLLVSINNKEAYIAGNWWVIFAAITWAIYATLQKIQFSKGWTPLEINILIYVFCAILLTSTANFAELRDLNAWQWFIMFLLGFNTFLAYGAFAEALNLIPASIVSLIISINPLLTLILVELITQAGLTFIQPEPVHWRGYFGAFLVVSGVGTAVYLRRR